MKFEVCINYSSYFFYIVFNDKKKCSDIYSVLLKIHFFSNNFFHKKDFRGEDIPKGMTFNLKLSFIIKNGSHIFQMIRIIYAFTYIFFKFPIVSCHFFKMYTIFKYVYIIRGKDTISSNLQAILCCIRNGRSTVYDIKCQ